MSWLVNNIGTILVAVVVFGGLGFIAFRYFRGKKKNSCGGGCAGCPMNGKCHKV